jgi:hypothetical protein
MNQAYSLGVKSRYSQITFCVVYDLCPLFECKGLVAILQKIAAHGLSSIKLKVQN